MPEKAKTSSSPAKATTASSQVAVTISSQQVPTTNKFYTGLGDDNINAGDGDNTIEPGTGNDSVSVGNGSDQIVLEAGEGSVSIFGFNAIADKLRLGGSLVGKSISLVTELGSTLVKAGDDLLATIKDVPTGVQKAFVSADIPLYRYQVVDLGAIVGQLDSDGLNTRTVNTATLWEVIAIYRIHASFMGGRTTEGISSQ
jgi:Ca2+-binding RTX toxin-like protein